MTLKTAGRVGAVLFVIGLAISCSQPKPKDIVLRSYSLDTLEGIVRPSGMTTDHEIKKEGAAALRVSVSEPSVIPLLETGDIDVENAVLVYRAKIRTQDVQGNVYLEMWCYFAGKGEFFSRALQSPLVGTADWTSQETVFFLKEGENPDNIRLNIVCEGAGTLWLDDLLLLKRMPPN